MKPLSALGREFLAVESIGPVTVAEVMDVALASLAARRGQEAVVGAAAAQAGIPLPPPGRAEVGAVCGAFWVSPEMWFLEAPFATHEDVVAHLRPVFGEAASITEQTDAWARLNVTGPLGPLFERLCNLDLGRFEPGSATRTVIEHVGCYAIRRAPERMTVLGPRSMAGSLHHALTVAARSVA
nr:sarcosine oxidase subunit gamma [Rubellimicrobium aerolatum]